MSFFRVIFVTGLPVPLTFLNGWTVDVELFIFGGIFSGFVNELINGLDNFKTILRKVGPLESLSMNSSTF